jgi:sterol desaturase/sphingolipid hydroxylase (fatty acid hydroxylase superfamily)
MSTSRLVAWSLLLLPANYYAATLTLWVGHWFAHQRWSPLRAHHVYSHHRVHPDSGHFTSDTFVFARGRYDSNKAFFPWFLIPIGATLAFLPPGLAAVSLCQLVAMTSFVAWIHAEVHRTCSRLDRWPGFARMRRRHAHHHDADRNYAVGDPLWDRVFGTFQDAPDEISTFSADPPE